MQSDMRGIIEEQRISRRKPRSSKPRARRANTGSDSLMSEAREDSWSTQKGWLTNGSTAPDLSETQPLEDLTVDLLEQAPAHSRATEPFLPHSSVPGFAGKAPGTRPSMHRSSRVLSASGLSSIAEQRPARRRADRLWLRRFVRPHRTMTSVLVGSQAGTLQRVPVCYLATAIAIPLALVALALVLNTVVASRGIISERFGVEMPAIADATLLLDPVTDRTRGDGEPLSIDASAYEAIRRTEYVVQDGDTISEIAEAFDLKTGTILSMNPIGDVRRMLPGTILYIPNRDGLFHSVAPGESLSSIATEYGVAVSAILDANDVESPILQVGDDLFIPGAEMPAQDFLLAIGELFNWPVRNFYFTSGFGMREHPISGTWHMHTGVDLANSIGTPVLAAGAGRVVHVEDQTTNYGKMIIIDHGNGYRTLYGHLNSFAVSWGDYVSVGTRIGGMGTTGRSTGPHLHFSVFRGSQPVDPLSQLGDR
jgi:murein DD-endopeptidase MepM/ murein hydrolase activator NlpD